MKLGGVTYTNEDGEIIEYEKSWEEHLLEQAFSYDIEKSKLQDERERVIRLEAENQAYQTIHWR